MYEWGKGEQQWLLVAFHHVNDPVFPCCLQTDSFPFSQLLERCGCHTYTLVLPTFIFIFLLPVGTKTGFQVFIQKKRKFTINRNKEYTKPSDCFLYLHRTLLFLFTWHTFACLSVVVIIYWGILDFWHYFADSAFEEGFAHLFIWFLISRMLWPWLSLLGTTVIQTADQ